MSGLSHTGRLHYVKDHFGAGTGDEMVPSEGRNGGNQKREMRFAKAFPEFLLVACVSGALWYIPNQKKNGLKEGSILSLALLDLMDCKSYSVLLEQEACSGHRQKSYLDTIGWHTKLGSIADCRTGPSVFEWWEPKELNVPIESEDEEARKERLLGMNGDAAVVVRSAKPQQTFAAVLHKRLAEVTCRNLG